MPTQKTFKRRVRARSAKTGESYTAARSQLIRRADQRSAPMPQVELPVADEAMVRGTGRPWADWFELLDGWSATERRHPEIARWLREEHGVDGWWAQSITVGYERARGMRAKYQTASGFVAAASRTVNAEADSVMAAFVDPARRRRWLPEVSMRRRPTRAPTSARFDWPDPPSIVVVFVDRKGERKTAVTVQHEKLPDAAAVERMKSWWRERLVALRSHLESSGPA